MIASCIGASLFSLCHCPCPWAPLSQVWPQGQRAARWLRRRGSWCPATDMVLSQATMARAGASLGSRMVGGSADARWSLQAHCWVQGPEPLHSSKPEWSQRVVGSQVQTQGRGTWPRASGRVWPRSPGQGRSLHPARPPLAPQPMFTPVAFRLPAGGQGSGGLSSPVVTQPKVRPEFRLVWGEGSSLAMSLLWVPSSHKAQHCPTPKFAALVPPTGPSPT